MKLGDRRVLMGGVALLLAAMYLVASLGAVPSPAMIGVWLGRAAGERYPCEACGCGCASAEACWTNCCCHTEHERLVWAIRNGVEPPESVRFTEAQWLAAANAVEAGSAHCGLCVAGVQADLRRGVARGTPAGHDDAPDRPSCDACTSDDAGCGGCADAGTGPEGTAVATPSRSPLRTISALACKGLRLLLVPAVPPPVLIPVLVGRLQREASDRCGIEREPAPSTRVLDVPVPPPRVC